MRLVSCFARGLRAVVELAERAWEARLEKIVYRREDGVECFGVIDRRLGSVYMVKLISVGHRVVLPGVCGGFYGRVAVDSNRIIKIWR